MEAAGREGRYFHSLPDGRIQCDLCPRDCCLKEGQRGLCFVRKNEGGRMWLTTYGRSSGLCIDPIEKKPLHHFYPGSSVLSLGTAGCNLTCKFCQNWDISKSRDMDTLADTAPPETIAQAALQHGCRAVAYTYNDPTVFVEYAMDIADACHEVGVKSVGVTAGYIYPEPRADFYSKLDALNVDLKAFTEEFYRTLCSASLQAVKETLLYLARETSCWVEVTTLLIPGHNDGEAEIRSLSEWIAEELGPHVPLHFSAFHPDFRMRNLPRTPLRTLQVARTIAQSVGLRHVYTGNVHDREGDTTWCTLCGCSLIVRDWYEIVEYRLTASGCCPRCGTALAGRFGEAAGSFGRRRYQIQVSRD